MKKMLHLHYQENHRLKQMLHLHYQENHRLKQMLHPHCQENHRLHHHPDTLPVGDVNLLAFSPLYIINVILFIMLSFPSFYLFFFWRGSGVTGCCTCVYYYYYVLLLNHVTHMLDSLTVVLMYCCLLILTIVTEASHFVCEVVAQGYKIPFITMPEAKLFSNQKSAIDNGMFGSEAIADLRRDGSVRMVSEKPAVCSPLLVATSRSNKLRLLINLGYINRFLWKDKFKYEDIHTALAYFEKGLVHQYL